MTIARDPQNPGALDSALASIFAKSFDDQLSQEVPACWRGWVRHQVHPEIPVDEAPPGISTIVGRSGLTSGLTPPRLVRAPDPSFSDEARRRKVSGIVVLGLIVDRTGRPHDVSIMRPLGMGLDEEAVEAVSQYEFAPAMRNGEPVPVLIHIEVNFRIY